MKDLEMIDLSPVWSVFFMPVRTFKALACASQEAWIAPFLVYGALSVLVAWGSAPALSAGLKQAWFAHGAPAPADAVEDAIALVSGQQPARLLIAPLALLAGWLAQAGLIWLLIRLRGRPPSSATLLTIVGYAGAVVALGELLSLMSVYWHGFQQAVSPFVLFGDFGVYRLVETESLLVEGALRSINPFSIWSLTLMTMGLSLTGRLGYGTAGMVAVAAWLVATSGRIFLWNFMLKAPEDVTIFLLPMLATVLQ